MSVPASHADRFGRVWRRCARAALSALLVCGALLSGGVCESQTVVDGPAGYTMACVMHKAVGVPPGVRPCAELGAAQRCEHEAEFPSRPTEEATVLTIVNRSDEAVKFYWLDRAGFRKLYQVVQPGDHVRQESHLGANWLVTTQDGHCVGIFNAAPISIALF